MSVPWIDAPPLERVGQASRSNPSTRRPEPDVPVRRVLVLDPRQIRSSARGIGEAHALEEQLAGEQRPVELLNREDALGQPRDRTGRQISECWY